MGVWTRIHEPARSWRRPARASTRLLARAKLQPLLSDDGDAALGSVQPLWTEFGSNLGAQDRATTLNTLFVPPLFQRDLCLTAPSRDRARDDFEVFAGDGRARRHGV